MNKSTIFVGIDISKDNFDVYIEGDGHHKFSNEVKGFNALVKHLGKSHWCVMEATSYYHYPLAKYLHAKGINVSVVNPLVVKRFIQMKLKRIKTDKSDARMIAQYGIEQPLEIWEPPAGYIEDSKMLHTVLQLYFKQSTSLKNKLHSTESSGKQSGVMIRSLKRQLKQIQQEIKVLETELENLIETNEPELYTLIKSIPGIGKKTAILLIVGSDGFRKFETPKQMVSFLGLAPNERSSGSSIRGKSRIGKNGQAITRNHLFMCSFTACACNPACKALYERLVNKGKSKKLALIAVCNKLARQAYGVAKSGLPFDPNYQSKLV